MRYFFVGIGGVSMSALAKLLHSKGAKVFGSDVIESDNTRELQALGIVVYIGHRASNILQQPLDRVVINGAITDNNPEVLQAKVSNIKIIYRETLLATISRRYQRVIAVAGCHGKSSTTAMIGEIFQTAGLEPTVHNGVKDNLKIGGKQFFITEACEFRKSFLKLKPSVAVITNVDADHLDCYRDLNEIKQCFAKYAAKAEIVIKNATDLHSVDLYGKRRTITFGIEYGDVHAKNLQTLSDGSLQFEVVTNPKVFGQFYQKPCFKMRVYGRHNVANALAAITCALVQGIEITPIQRALLNYRGIARRFQQFYHIRNTPVILDYAHHPHEITTTIQTANHLYRKYLLVFQPHTYTRTISLWDDFIDVLGKVEHLVLYKTYAARGKAIIGGRALDLSRHLQTKYFASPQSLRQYLYQVAAEYDAIILCGAGDVVAGNFLLDN